MHALHHCTCEVTFWYGSAASQHSSGVAADHHQLNACCSCILYLSLPILLLFTTVLFTGCKDHKAEEQHEIEDDGIDRQMRARCDMCPVPSFDLSPSL